MRYKELVEDKSTNIFELNPKFEKLLYRWYGGQEGRDKFLELNIPAKYKEPPKAQYVYRYIKLDSAVISKIIFDKKAIKLKARYKTSSWTPKRSIIEHITDPTSNKIVLVAKKQIKKDDIVIYTPNITKYHRALVRGMDSTARDAMLEEQELIIRNTPYWLTIKPSDVVFIDDASVKDFIDNADDYFDIKFLKKKGIVTDYMKRFPDEV